MIFPPSSVPGPLTRIVAHVCESSPPVVLWTGVLDADDTAGASQVVQPNGPGMPLLGEHSRRLFTRPHLRGHRLRRRAGAVAAGQDWSTAFAWQPPVMDGRRLVFAGVDSAAGLSVRVEFESLVGGGVRGRASVTNDADDPYLVEGLEVVLPVGDHLTDLLDFTGRHEHERAPQRHVVTDGLYLREARTGRPGLGGATMFVLGSEGFDTTSGDVLGVHVAWSGNTVLRVERDAATGTTVGGGELLLPGEVVLGAGESHVSAWVHFAAADGGLDGLAAVWHAHQRSLPAHPARQPVVLNVWEAVFFDHDLDRLTAIADRAARVGVERFVLDDGWFQGRRDDTAGLGDWWVDEQVWPDGLAPLIDHVRGLGMEFGLWFEPEMVNPDSQVFREHPDWILSAGGRVPALHRHQHVLDLTRDEVWQYVFSRVDAVLGAHAIDYVKWDHNRDLLEAGSSARGGAAAVHEQTVAFLRLLDALKAAHPDVAWESCASGGGRIDLDVLERIQRVWASDMTDALARQQIQRWTVQLLAPEYIGAHVSSPTSHTTGRTLSLDFRAATAMFGSFGIEWDLTEASDDELGRLADWVARYRRFRPLLHGGRTVRPTSPDPTVLVHGVVAPDRAEALIAHVQLDEPSHNRGVWVRVPGLDPDRRYAASWEGPTCQRAVSMSAPLADVGPTGGAPISGAVAAKVGLWVPRRRPETVTLIHLIDVRALS